MTAIQVRIDEATHRTIKSLASDLGESMQGVVERAVERFRRDIFLEGLNRDFDNLRRNPDEWGSEIEERMLWDTALTDRESN